MSNSLLKNALLRSTMLVGAAVIAVPAFAQTGRAQNVPDQSTPAMAPGADEDVIVVTGTLVRNPNIESTSPVSVVSEAELTLRNVNTVEQVIRQLPGATPGIGSAVNNGATGFATADLRGLGAKRNLVLLDGDRLVPANQSGVVDLNVIPTALIQRSEVLTGGASTTYGADAVSGVVNFITRKDFEGIDLSGSYQITEKGDGAYYRTDLTVGGNFADDRGNAVLSVGYQNADAIYFGSRGFSEFGLSSSTGRASGASFTSVPTTFSFPTADLQVNAGGTALVPQYQGFNFNPYNIFQTPFKRHNVFGAANYEVTDGLEVYGRALFSKNVISSIIAPSGIFGEALTIPGNNPYLPAGIRDQLCTQNGIALGAACNTATAIPLPAVYRRSVELGPRISDYTTQFFDYKVGARYDVSDAFGLDISLHHGESELDQRQSGYVLRSRVQQALNATSTTACNNTANGCVPLNLFGPAGSITPAQAKFLNGASTIKIKNELDQIRGVASGDIGYTLPWADEGISYAVGAEYREYGYTRQPDNLASVPGELGGAGGAVLPFDGGYDVKEVYGELVAPLAADRPFFNQLTAEAGIRHSWYTVDAPGNPKFDATTWKVGLQWEPVDAIKIRGNYQRAVRAPNIAELFAPVVTGLTNLNVDPCAGAAPAANPNLALACINQGAPVSSIGLIQQPSAGQANATGGGNPNIQPEKADTYTVGVILQPKALVSGLTVSVDYYNITINDAITSATPGDVINACFGSNPSAITAAQANSAACTSIRRSAANGRLSGSSATIPGLPTPLTNNGRLKTDGIDLKVDYRTELGFADLSLNFLGNWTASSQFKASPSSVNRECVGYYSANCGVQLGQLTPEFSWNQRTTLSFDVVDVSLLWRYVDSMRYEPGLPPLFRGTITNAPGASSVLAGRTVDFNKIKAYNYFDLSTRFNLGEHYELVLGVQNLFDKAPPLVGGEAGTTTANGGNTFPSTYDSLGRLYTISAHIRF